MQFHSAPDHDGLVYRQVSENNMIEIGVSFVIFGHRIRVGYVGCLTYELDYCAGPNQEDVETLYAVVQRILESQDEQAVNWSIFPRQHVKPVFNDRECWPRLLETAVDVGDILEMPDLYALRSKQHADISLLLGVNGLTPDQDAPPLNKIR